MPQNHYRPRPRLPTECTYLGSIRKNKKEIKACHTSAAANRNPHNRRGTTAHSLTTHTHTNAMPSPLLMRHIAHKRKPSPSEGTIDRRPYGGSIERLPQHARETCQSAQQHRRGVKGRVRSGCHVTGGFRHSETLDFQQRPFGAARTEKQAQGRAGEGHGLPEPATRLRALALAIT